MVSTRLPGKNRVLQACRGIDYGDHLVLRLAHDLAELHERRLSAGSDVVVEIDRARANLVKGIDDWAAASLPPAIGAAYVHTETVGAIVDRLAQFTAHAFAALAGGPVADLGNVWERLAELAIGYEDLVEQVHTGHRRLPGGL